MKKFLSASLLAVFLIALSAEMWHATAGPQVLTPFPLGQNRLQTGTPFYTCAITKVQGWLNAVNPENILYIWRQEYGMATPGTAMGSWEAPSCNLRGHYTGHILSSFAMCYALTGNAVILNKARYIIRSLDTCQRRAVGRGMSAGCLSAHGEDLFIALENGGTYGGNPNVWAPWYSQHKVFAGLIKCYQEMGDTLALHVAKDMATWGYNRLRVLPTATLQSMWSRYIAGEYGGMNESAAELYLITGRAEDRAFALLFDDNTTYGASLPNLINNIDNLEPDNIYGGTRPQVCHANMYLPRVIGYLRDYDANSTASYYNAAYYFFDMVDLHHRFCNGGINANPDNAEAFFLPNGEAGRIGDGGSSVETCASYNMMKLSKYLYYHDVLNSKYHDLADRTTFNELLRISNSNSTSTTVWARYGTPVMNNMSSSCDNSDLTGGNATCCGGTSMETPYRMVEGIFAYRGDTLFINTFIGDTLNWSSKGVTVAMNTLFPERDTVRLTITATGTVTMPVKIRAPWWKRRPWTITINGSVVPAVAAGNPNYRIPPSSVFRLPQTTWTGTNTVVIVMPQSLRFEAAKGAASTGPGAIMCGPVVLTSPGQAGYRTITTTGTNTRVSATSASWTIGGVAFTPQYRVTAAYNTYQNVTSIPSSWLDTLWEPLPAVMNPAVTTTPAVTTPTLKVVRSQIHISFDSPAASSQTLRIQLFNALGAMVADLNGMVNKGDRAATLHQTKDVLPAGMYMCNLTLGGQRSRISLVCNQ